MVESIYDSSLQLYMSRYQREINTIQYNRRHKHKDKIKRRNISTGYKHKPMNHLSILLFYKQNFLSQQNKTKTKSILNKKKKRT